jgi:hypothetical protein
MSIRVKPRIKVPRNLFCPCLRLQTSTILRSTRLLADLDTLLTLMVALRTWPRGTARRPTSSSLATAASASTSPSWLPSASASSTTTSRFPSPVQPPLLCRHPRFLLLPPSLKLHLRGSFRFYPPFLRLDVNQALRSGALIASALTFQLLSLDVQQGQLA